MPGVEAVPTRKYQLEDIDRCRDLWRSLNQRHRDICEDPELGGPDPGLEFDDYLKRADLHGIWLAMVGTEIVGLCGLLLDGDESELEPIVLDAAYRRRGIGALLAQLAVSEARNPGSSSRYQIQMLGSNYEMENQVGEAA